MNFKYALTILFWLLALSSKGAILRDHELTTSLKCSKLFHYYEKRYKIPLDTLHAISLKESGKYNATHKMNIVWPWAVNVAGKGYYFASKREAVDFVKQQLKKGITSIDVGCMQVSLKYHPNAFASIEQAFEPKYNIEKAAIILRKKFDELQDWSTAIAHYHSAHKVRGKKYFAAVYKIAGNIDAYRLKLKNSVYNYRILYNPNAKQKRTNVAGKQYSRNTVATANVNKPKKLF